MSPPLPEGGEVFIAEWPMVVVKECPNDWTTSARVCFCAVFAIPPDASSFSSDEWLRDSSSQCLHL
jgi:hypothetical protein